MKVTGKSLAFDITNIYRKVTNPNWSFIFFQKIRLNNQQRNNSMFDHSNVKNLWIELSGRRYPEESLDLDWTNDKYCLAYNSFQDYKKELVKNVDSIPYVDIKDFKNLYPIYSIDLSDQPKRISDVKSNVILYVDFKESISSPTGNEEGTVCYIIVISKNVLLYEPNKNRIIEQN
jgi:hypothetical protein